MALETLGGRRTDSDAASQAAEGRKGHKESSRNVLSCCEASHRRSLIMFLNNRVILAKSGEMGFLNDTSDLKALKPWKHQNQTFPVRNLKLCREGLKSWTPDKE